jgi:hypothetical protein
MHDNILFFKISLVFVWKYTYSIQTTITLSLYIFMFMFLCIDPCFILESADEAIMQTAAVHMK